MAAVLVSRDVTKLKTSQLVGGAFDSAWCLAKHTLSRVPYAIHTSLRPIQGCDNSAAQASHVTNHKAQRNARADKQDTPPSEGKLRLR